VQKEPKSKARVLADVCAKLALDASDDAAAILRLLYPFEPLQNAGRNWSPLQTLGIFLRDGFIDRYTGQPLIFPGTLRIISLRIPAAFPFHPNWKTDECHFAYWELVPTIDHVLPVSRGGVDDETNWVTTSMMRNAAKANFTLEEVGWQLLPQSIDASWDGLTSWFSNELIRDPELLKNAYIQRWARALHTITTSTKVAAEG
jgi:hypothetical protein